MDTNSDLCSMLATLQLGKAVSFRQTLKHLASKALQCNVSGELPVQTYASMLARDTKFYISFSYTVVISATLMSIKNITNTTFIIYRLQHIISTIVKKVICLNSLNWMGTRMDFIGLNFSPCDTFTRYVTCMCHHHL